MDLCGCICLFSCNDVVCLCMCVHMCVPAHTHTHTIHIHIHIRDPSVKLKQNAKIKSITICIIATNYNPLRYQNMATLFTELYVSEAG
jgi:hypothetical protein